MGACLCEGIVVVGGQVPSDPHPVVVRDACGFQVDLLHLLVLRSLAFYFETRGAGCEYPEGIVSTCQSGQLSDVWLVAHLGYGMWRLIYVSLL